MSDMGFIQGESTAPATFNASGLGKAAGKKTTRLTASEPSEQIGAQEKPSSRVAVAIFDTKKGSAKPRGLNKLRFMKMKMVDGSSHYVNINSATKRLHITGLRTLQIKKALGSLVTAKKSSPPSDPRSDRLHAAFAASQGKSGLGAVLDEYAKHYQLSDGKSKDTVQDAQMKSIGWNRKALLSTVKVACQTSLENKKPLISVKSENQDRRAIIQPGEGGAETPRFQIHAIATHSLGQGTFGVVSKALNTLSHEMKAVKESIEAKNSAKKDLENEKSQLALVNQGGPWVGIQAQYELSVDSLSGKGTLAITKLYRGDAQDLIFDEGSQDLGGGIDLSIPYVDEYNKDARQGFVQDMFAGLQRLDDQHLIQPDLKLANLLVDESDISPKGRPRIVLSDFGGVGTAESIQGQVSRTPGYYAQEDLSALKAKKGDTVEGGFEERLKAHLVFSAAVTAYQLITGERPPLKRDKKSEEVHGLTESDTRLTKTIKDSLIKNGFNQTQAEALVKGLNAAYDARPSIQELAGAFGVGGSIPLNTA